MLPLKFVCSCKLKRVTFTCLVSTFLFGVPASAQSVSITSPTSGSNNPFAVQFTASASGWNSTQHLEVWDQNGSLAYLKLGNVFPSGSSLSTNVVYVLPKGTHTTQIKLVDSNGTTVVQGQVTYDVAPESCTSGVDTGYCNFDQLPVNDPSSVNCSDPPPPPTNWISNDCAGVEGSDGNLPASIEIEPQSETGIIPDAFNTTLDGNGMYFEEQQGSGVGAGGYSNVLFKADAPSNYWDTTGADDTNWTLDAYVYLPNPNAHQAFEIDTQFVINDVWTKFYTECAFNISSGTGYWEVFDPGTGTWAETSATCDRSQFYTPWSGGPAWTSGPLNGYPFSGWHHIVWKFHTNNDGTIEYLSVMLDGKTNTLNYTPASKVLSGGDNGAFSALVQLDGDSFSDPNCDKPSCTTVDAYVNEFNVTHSN